MLLLLSKTLKNIKSKFNNSNLVDLDKLKIFIANLYAVVIRVLYLSFIYIYIYIFFFINYKLFPLKVKLPFIILCSHITLNKNICGQCNTCI